jgi:hypothetical protein
VSARNQALPVGVRRSAVTAADGPTAPALRLAEGLSWTHPDAASCASTARKHLRQALAGPHIPRELIDHAAAAVSELFFPRFESVSPKAYPKSLSCLLAGSSLRISGRQ